MTRSTRVFKLVEKDVHTVWAALTEPRQLQGWLCQKASVTLATDGVFELASRIPHIGGRHTLVGFEPAALLRFDWRIGGHVTEVAIRLEDIAGLTRVVVSHAVPEGMPEDLHIDDSMGTKMGFIANVWGYTLDLLKEYAETGKTSCVLRTDEDPLNIDWSIELPLESKAVFAALMEPEQIRKWNPFAGEKLRVEPRVGGRYSFGWSGEESGVDGPGEIVELRDGHKLTYTWHGKQKTLVSWEVEPLAHTTGPRTRLRMTHSGFVTDPALVWEFKLGWAGFLAMIRDALTGTRPASEIGGYA